jgi:hypothetical protein
MNDQLLNCRQAAQKTQKTLRKRTMKFALLCLGCFLAAHFASAQVANRFAFPALAGVRLREANVTPGTNDSGESALYGVAANYYDQDYYWTSGAGPSGDEWDHWIVPQILAAKAAGANCIRMMWSADAFIGDSSHHGAAAWLGTNTYSGLTNEIGMVASLCQSNGLWFYPSCSDSRVLDVGNNPTNMIALYLSNFCAEAVLYPNVACIDVVQEADGTASGTNSGFVAQDCKQWIASAHAGMTASGRTVPVTCSLNGAANAGDLNLVNRWQAYNLIAAGVDYLDCHAYYQYSIGDFYQAVTNRWNIPVVFGETGMNMSGVYGSGPDNETTHPYSSEIRQDFFFAAAQAVAEQPYYQLTGIWAIAPNWLTSEEDFGLYGGTQSATYALTNPRDQLRNFAMFPTMVQPANYAWSIVCTGINTTASSYNNFTRYAVGSGMLDVSTNSPNNGHGIWQRNSSMVQDLGCTSTLNLGDGSEILYQTSLPNSLGEFCQFDIPPQSPALYNSEFATWGIFTRGQANGNGYLIDWTSDNGHTYDNKVEIFSYVAGVKTSLTNITYGSALDLTKWWRFAVTVSSNTNPTTITVTVSNLTSAVAMTPSLVCVDATPSLQSPGGIGLSGFLGQPYYTNINFAMTFDTAPTVAAPPTGTASGANVALTWPAAAMGSGTVNYTPQFVVADWSANFPSANTWTSGVPTNGTSATVNGVPTSANVIFRVMSVDAIGATNYSPWQLVTTGAGSTTSTAYIPFKF